MVDSLTTAIPQMKKDCIFDAKVHASLSLSHIFSRLHVCDSVSIGFFAYCRFFVLTQQKLFFPASATHDAIPAIPWLDAKAVRRCGRTSVLWFRAAAAFLFAFALLGFLGTTKDVVFLEHLAVDGVERAHTFFAKLLEFRVVFVTRKGGLLHLRHELALAFELFFLNLARSPFVLFTRLAFAFPVKNFLLAHHFIQHVQFATTLVAIHGLRIRTHVARIGCAKEIVLPELASMLFGELLGRKQPCSSFLSLVGAVTLSEILLLIG